jgi:hypothetical protein
MGAASEGMTAYSDRRLVTHRLSANRELHKRRKGLTSPLVGSWDNTPLAPVLERCRGRRGSPDIESAPFALGVYANLPVPNTGERRGHVFPSGKSSLQNETRERLTGGSRGNVKSEYRKREGGDAARE